MKKFSAALAASLVAATFSVVVIAPGATALGYCQTGESTHAGNTTEYAKCPLVVKDGASGVCLFYASRTVTNESGSQQSHSESCAHDIDRDIP